MTTQLKFRTFCISALCALTFLSFSADDWKSLFDGKSLNGWHVYNQGKAASKWIAKNGELQCNPEMEKGVFGDLITDKSYENFDLTYEWKISKGGNSGVFINVQEEEKYGATFTTGLEMQLLDNENGESRHKENPTHWAGMLYDVTGNNANSDPKPFGEWNQSRIKQQDGKVTFWLNGKVTADVDLNGQDWKNALAKSELGKLDDYAKFRKGKIALQNHTDKVAFRNMKIKEI